MVVCLKHIFSILLIHSVILINFRTLTSTEIERPLAIFPLQFSANVLITAHQLDDNSDYPPKTRRMTIYYDYVNKRARADLEAGYEAAKLYIRRYDNKNEYMVRLPPINDCKRSYLGDIMPFPDIPNAFFVASNIDIDGIKCNYFIHEDFDTRIHIYMSMDDNSPVRLLQESIEDNISIEMLTYDYSDVILEPPDIGWFELPEPYEHKTCTNHAGGFPYLHIFHYFVKF